MTDGHRGSGELGHAAALVPRQSHHVIEDQPTRCRREDQREFACSAVKNAHNLGVNVQRTTGPGGTS